MRMQTHLGSTVAVLPSQNPADYVAAGWTIPGETYQPSSPCAWYEEQKASGSVVSCQFPSTTVVIVGAVAVLGLLLLTR